MAVRLNYLLKKTALNANSRVLDKIFLEGKILRVGGRIGKEIRTILNKCF
jgi:hypothetical protein